MSAAAPRLGRLLSDARPFVVYLYPRGGQDAALDEIEAHLPPGTTLARCHFATEALGATAPVALHADPYAERGLVAWVDALREPFSRRTRPLVLLLEAGGAGEAALREHAELARSLRGRRYSPAPAPS